MRSKIMNIFFKLCIYIVFIGYSVTLSGQQLEISGKIIDIETKKPIPFSSIAIKEIYKGTASNLLGEFSFKVDSLPIVLVISHLSYEPFELKVENTQHLVIELSPGELLMDEVIVKAKGNNEYAYNLVGKAYRKIVNDYSSQYGKAFYRQISQNGDEYSELYEIFYDTRFSNNGVDDWAIQEGRYALKLSTADSFIYNKNFTLMVRLLSIVQPKTQDLIMPISESVYEQYDLVLSEILFVNNRKVARIRFNVKKDVRYPAMDGDLFIDVETYDVLKVNGTITNDNLKFITLKGEKGSWKNYQVYCEIAFKPIEDNKLVLEYMRLGQNFDYYFDGVFTNKVRTESFLSYYEYYTPPKRKKLGGRLIRFNKRDADLLDNIGYNQGFWDDNIIVKRTPIESEVIESFEEERAFGSIYLNNKNQIVLEDYEMDSDSFIVKMREQLKTYDLPRNGEKVYLHQDRPFYLSGDHLWFRSYLLNMATNIPIKRSGGLHVHLVSPNGSLISSGLFKIDNGLCFGNIQLPAELKSGEYSLIAFSDYMRNYDPKLFFNQTIEIFNTKNESGNYHRIIQDSTNTLTFYAEGGQLIESMPTQVGYYASDQFGDGINVKGRIVNEEGRSVAQLKEKNHGFGSLFMMPRKEHQYRTLISSHEVNNVDFPPINSSGYSIMINTLKPNTIDVSIRGTMKLEGKKFYLLVLSDGILYDRRVCALTRGLYKAEFPKKNLPNGKSQILLIDDQEQVKIKRFVYVNQPEEVTAKYYLAKKEFKPRERIDMVIELKDENGKAVNNADISVSVVNRDRISRSKMTSNINTYVDLEFSADHDIINPNELLVDHSRETLKKLDWFMLAQKSAMPSINSFEHERVSEVKDMKKGFSLSGKATITSDGKPLSNGRITIVHYPDFSHGFIIAKTDDTGYFSIENVNLIKSTRAIVIAQDKLGNRVNVQLTFDRQASDIALTPRNTKLMEIPRDRQGFLKTYTTGNHDSTLLNTSSNQMTKKFDSPYGKSDHVVTLDEKYRSSTDLMDVLKGRFPDVNVIGRGDRQRIRIRGLNDPPVVIRDGLLLLHPTGQNDDEAYDASLISVLSKINLDDIQLIEVIKKIERAEFADQNGGMIILYSHRAKNSELVPGKDGVAEIILPGFDASYSFLSPDYSSKDNLKDGYDSRTTLYWNPNIQTNKRGRARLGFYNSDDARNFQICIEGITEGGVPIFSIYEFGRNRNR